ncbi:hypothetical protein ACB092_09G100500 [Castanea dentata]
MLLQNLLKVALTLRLNTIVALLFNVHTNYHKQAHPSHFLQSYNIQGQHEITSDLVAQTIIQCNTRITYSTIATKPIILSKKRKVHSW